MDNQELKSIFQEEDRDAAVKGKDGGRRVSIKIIAIITVISIVVMGACFGIGIAVGANSGIKNDMPLMQEVYKLIKEYYYKDISWNDFQKLAAGEMAGSLDNFSFIISQSDDSTSTGSFGFNISSNVYNEHIISFVVPQSAAWNATANFKFSEADEYGTPTMDESFDGETEVVKIDEGDKIYGLIVMDAQRSESKFYKVENANSQYMRNIISENDALVFVIKKYVGDGRYSQGYYGFYMEKSVFEESTVYYYDHIGDVGIIKVTEFGVVDTTEAFAECVNKFIADGNKKLILDLRNNGGGNSATLEYMARFLLNNPSDVDQPIIKLESNAGNGKKTSRYVKSSKVDQVNGGNSLTAFPIASKVKDFDIVVLCNGGSASASEALIGALQYYNNTKIVGNTTYGKGVAQRTFTLSTGDLLYVTNGTYYVPTVGEDGGTDWSKCIHGVGFTPDKENIVEERSLSYDKDPYVKRAMELFGK